MINRKKENLQDFKNKYRRYTRDVQFRIITDEDVLSSIPLSSIYMYGEISSEPHEKAQLHYEVNAEDVLKNFNQLLIYRLFKQLYGSPDTYSAYLDVEQKKTYPVDWIYSVHITDFLVADVINRNSSRIYLRFWSLKQNSDPAKMDYSIKIFINKLDYIIKNNGSLFNEKIDRTNLLVSRGIVNIAAQRYHNADELYGLAELIDKKPNKTILKKDESIPICTSGKLYLASAIYYFISLETLVNIIIHIYMKDTYRLDKELRKDLRKKPLEDKINATFLCCDGFVRQPIGGNNVKLLQDLTKIKWFRNDILHGNLTNYNEVDELKEDGFMFYYKHGSDFASFDSSRELSRFQSDITSSHVLSIKATVDNIREAIIDAMDPETKLKVETWLWSSLITL